MMFPGQGSQSVGMLAALGAAEPIVRETFDEASAVLGYDLWSLCQQGPEDRLSETERTQPAMLAASRIFSSAPPMTDAATTAAGST